MKRQGNKNSAGRRDYSEAEVSMVRSLAAEGRTVLGLSLALNRTWDSIRYIAKKHNINIPMAERSPGDAEWDYHNLSKYPSDRNNLMAYPQGPQGEYRGK